MTNAAFQPSPTVAETTGRDEPITRQIAVNDITLSYAEWHASARGHGPTLLLSHATGFHGRVWDQLLKHLPPWHAIAVDLRGHGRSTPVQIKNWAQIGEDLTQLARQLDLRDIIGVGHSMGAHTLVRACAADQQRYRGLFLFDPTILPKENHRPGETFDVRDHPVSRRNARFASPQAMRDRFADREPYASFDPQVLIDYCQYGLLPAPDGEGYELACRPETEASVYLSARVDDRVYEAIPKISLPVLIARAKLPTPDRNPHDYSFSPTWPPLATLFQHARDIHFADRNHLMPLESPAQTAALIREFVESVQAGTA